MSMETTTQMNKVFEYINLEYLNMMADGDDEMKKVMLSMLFEEMPIELETMASLLAKEDWTELSAVCHKMKSTLSFVGNEAMTKANTTLEILTKTAEDTDTYPELLDTITQTWPKVLVELKEVHDSL